MTARRLPTLALCALLAVTAGCVAGLDDGPAPEPDPDEIAHPVEPPADVDASAYPARIELYDGEQRNATIYAETATTLSERYTGLSEHASLAQWEGMLFVYGSESRRTYVMRNMSFGIDVLFVDANGCVRDAHAAAQPLANESGEEDHHRYPGYGQYVIEVPVGVATGGGVDAGDPVRIEYGETVVDGTGACGVAQR